MLTMNKTSEQQEKSPESFIQALKDKNIRLWVEEGTLRYKAPKGTVSKEILEELKQKKDEIIQVLQEENDFNIFFEPICSVGEKDNYPLSAAQRRMLILNQLDRDSKAYNITQVLKMEGELDLACLEETICQLIARHDSLRTTFAFADDKPVQIIQPVLEYKPEYIEIEGTQQQADEIINEFPQPYQLDCLPLFRIKIIKLFREEMQPVYFLLLDMHHIISDGVSLAVLVNEINQLYAGVELPELKTRYVDYTVWNEKYMSGSLMKLQKQYWLDEFKGEVPTLHFPTDHPRPAVFSFNGRLVKRMIDKDLTHRLNHVARENKVTLYTVLFSAFSILIGRYSGQEDLIIGTPTAGRRHADVQNVIGNFVNTLAIRSFPALNKSFKDYLKETGSRILQAFDHQDYPFDQLVNDLKIQRDLSKNPLFEVMFILQNMGIAPVKAEGIEITDYDTGNGIAQFDITAIAVETDEGIELGINYCQELFDQATMERFAEHFIQILLGITADSEVELGQIQMLTERENQEILHDFNNTAVAFPEEKMIHQLFEEQVQRTPDHIAAVFQDKKLTYRELNNRANCLAGLLRRKGIGPDSIVAVVTERSLEMITGIMAILKAGGAYLPVSPSYPIDRIQYMIEDSGAQIILMQKKFTSQLPVWGLSDEKHPAPEILVLEDRSLYEGQGDNPEMIGTSRNLAYVIYTSGSTGRPKGVMIEHRSLINRLNWMQRKYPLTEEDVILQKTPYTFDVSVWELFWWSILGAQVCFLEPEGEKDPKAICDAIEKYKITTMHFVPSMLNAFLEYLEESGDVGRLSSLKRVFASGEALTVKQMEGFNRLLNRVHGTTLHNLYGPTEATVDVSYFDCPTDRFLRSVPIGKPIDNIQLYILDKKDRLQPIGVPGELCIAGDGLARGYLNRSELTGEKFVPNPYAVSTAQETRMYRSGDLAKWLPDGNIEYLGRLDNQVKIRGFRIELGEIESELLKHPEVKEAAVVVREKGADKSLWAYVSSEKELTVLELRSFLLQTLPDYMVPTHFMSLDRLPLTPSGKVDRKALPVSDSGLSTGVEYEAPRNEQEKVLVQIWQEVLGLERIGIRDDFFALGGDSLKAIKVVEKANRENMKISLPDIMRYRSVADILNISTQPSLPTSTEEETFSFDKMLRHNDAKIKMVCNAQQRIYNKDYSPIEYPFYYLCMFTVLAEYLKHVCVYEMELDFFNASVGVLLAGIVVSQDESGNICCLKGTSAGNQAGYPNALEALGVDLIPKSFAGKQAAIEYLMNCLKKNQVIPITVSTYHLNYTCDYHLSKEKLLEKVEVIRTIGEEFVATLHSLVVVDATEDSFVVHDTTFSYFGEVPREDFYKAFEGLRSVEDLQGLAIYEEAVPFEAFELITENLIRKNTAESGLEEMRKNLHDYLQGKEYRDITEDGQEVYRIYGIKAMEKVIQLFRTHVLCRPYDKKTVSKVYDVFKNWEGIFTLLRNSVRTLGKYYPIDSKLMEHFDTLLLNCHEIAAGLWAYDSARHYQEAERLSFLMEEALHMQRQSLEELDASLQRYK